MKKLLIVLTLASCIFSTTVLAESSQTIDTFVYFKNIEENTTCSQYTSVWLTGYYVNYVTNTITQAMSVPPTAPTLNNFVIPPYPLAPNNYFQIKSITVQDVNFPNDDHTFYVNANNFSGVIFGVTSENIYIDCDIIPTGQALGLSLNTRTDQDPKTIKTQAK